jgi:integrase
MKGKALSSLTAEDFLEFQAFLRNPPSSWISRKGTPRGSPEWTPFNCAAADAQVNTVMNGLGSLFNWMRDIGYADIKLATRYRVTRFGPVPSRGASNSLPDEPFSKLKFSDLKFVRMALSGPSPSTPLRMQLLFDLQFYGCLDASEVVRLRFCDVELEEPDEGVASLRILERQAARSVVYALPPLYQTLRDWHAAAGESRRDHEPIVLGYGAGDIRKASARLISFAAREAELAGDRSAHARLMRFRSGDLRHALLDALPTQFLTPAWHALGASVIADYRTALRRLPDRSFLRDEELRASMAAIMSAIQDGADSTSKDLS